MANKFIPGPILGLNPDNNHSVAFVATPIH